MRKKVKKLLLGIVGAISLLAVLYVYTTHGWIWSIYVPIYERLLNSFPSPPGLLPGTDKVTLNPELPWGYRQYKVDMNHEEVVNFFIAELPHAGWDLLKHKEWHGESEFTPGAYLKFDKMLFVKHRPYWLKRYWVIVEVFTDVDVGGIPTGKADVTLEIHRNEREALFRYKP